MTISPIFKTQNYFDWLPAETILQIDSYLDLFSTLAFSNTCSRFRATFAYNFPDLDVVRKVMSLLLKGEFVPFRTSKNFGNLRQFLFCERPGLPGDEDPFGYPTSVVGRYGESTFVVDDNTPGLIFFHHFALAEKSLILDLRQGYFPLIGPPVKLLGCFPLSETECITVTNYDIRMWDCHFESGASVQIKRLFNPVHMLTGYKAEKCFRMEPFLCIFWNGSFMAADKEESCVVLSIYDFATLELRHEGIVSNDIEDSRFTVVKEVICVSDQNKTELFQLDKEGKPFLIHCLKGRLHEADHAKLVLQRDAQFIIFDMEKSREVLSLPNLCLYPHHFQRIKLFGDVILSWVPFCSEDIGKYLLMGHIPLKKWAFINMNRMAQNTGPQHRFRKKDVIRDIFIGMAPSVKITLKIAARRKKNQALEYMEIDGMVKENSNPKKRGNFSSEKHSAKHPKKEIPRTT